LAANRLRDERSLRWMVWLFVGLGAIFVFALLVPSLKRQALRIFQRAVLDAMFWTWISALAFSQAYLNRRLAWGWRLALGSVALGAFYFTVVIRESWTSGWLPACVAIGVIVLVTKPKLAIAGLVVGGLSLVILPSLFGNVFLSGDNEYSLTTRLEA